MDKLTAAVFLVLLFCATAARNGAQPSSSNDEGICSEIVIGQNYPCKEHEVKTGDGFILSVQNIPHGRSGKTSGKRPPVLLQHGLSMDAMTWLLNPPGQSLALLLADNGFDVWLVSTRGTKYSRGHTSLTPDDAAYWDWSWDEVAEFDLPATFQYVCDQTGQKLHFVGHSMGTLVAFAAFSKGQLVNMLRSAAMLCPIAYLGNVTSPIARIGSKILLSETSHWLKIPEFDLREKLVLQLLVDICGQEGADCLHLFTSIMGSNCCLNYSALTVFIEHGPQPTSTKNMIHFSQMIRDGTINMFDYGDENKNRKRYGQPTPPSYNMSNIPEDIPLFLAHGGADALSVSADVELLLNNNLKGRQGEKLVVNYQNDFAHADYIMAVNARQRVYDPLMAFFRLH